jgi:glucosyl-3-phosphoglycerate synthase
MSEYSQKSTKITNFYQLSEETDVLDELVRHSRWKKPVLVIPALAYEFTNPESRPIFEKMPMHFTQVCKWCISSA